MVNFVNFHGLHWNVEFKCVKFMSRTPKGKVLEDQEFFLYKMAIIPVGIFTKSVINSKSRVSHFFFSDTAKIAAASACSYRSVSEANIKEVRMLRTDLAWTV